jgi:ferrous iron transport protein B
MTTAGLKEPAACHGGAPQQADGTSSCCVVLAGSPNVGKSALFNRLTSSYATVSNYPGTSVEVARGTMRIGAARLDVLDTPGLYSLLPGTDEERVTQQILLDGAADVIVHVIDAKNLERMLALSLQLAELGQPLVIALNMMDEAQRLGITVDHQKLARRIGVEVVPVVAIRGAGIEELKAAIERASHGAAPPLPVYENGVGHAVSQVADALDGDGVQLRSRVTARIERVSPESLITLALQGDADAVNRLQHAAPVLDIDALVSDARCALSGPPAYRVAFERRRHAQRLLEDVLTLPETQRPPWVDRLGTLLTRPATGLPVLALVIYLGLYRFVGLFGAGTLVDLIEGGLFENLLNPFFEGLFAGIPWEWLRALFVGDYGLLTLGVRYAVAIILPIVGTFFVFFSILEDSGYFPRLALLVDRAFKRIGLSGRAVIPMVLGFACTTMATMVTRTLETRRERILATVLLALAVPCSAQLGVIIAVLAGAPAALAVWAAVLLLTFLLVGLVTARLMPGAPASFHMELPPLRWPRPANVAVKTYTRMHWYFVEVLPLFLLASVLLWLGDLTGTLRGALQLLAPVVHALGLPADTAAVFLFGFFRRDYGAAGLFELSQQGLLSMRQLTVAAVTLTLFIPCVAQFLMMLKERGPRMALAVAAFITPFAFTMGWLLNILLTKAGW